MYEKFLEGKNLEIKKEEKINIPNDYPPKKSLLEEVGNALRGTAKDVKKFFSGNEIVEKKTTEAQEFVTKMMGFFYGIDIEKGAEVKEESDVKKIREIFLPILDLDHTGIEFQKGDIVKYNRETGNVEFYPIDGNYKTSSIPSGIVPIHERKIPEPKPEDFDNILNNLETKDVGKNIANSLGNFTKNLGPYKSGPDSCGRAVHMILQKFGMKNVPRGHGNQWKNMMEKDPRFKLVNVNSFDEIPVGGILTFSGKGKLNGKPHGSSMNQKYGHVEIKDANGNFTSFYSSKKAGGSAKAPNLVKDFAKWKEATGFTGVYIPIAKTKEEALKIVN